MATGMGHTSFLWVLGREYLKPWEVGVEGRSLMIFVFQNRPQSLPQE